jgi:hypothetical protein
MYHETRSAQSLSALAESQRKGNASFLRQTESKHIYLQIIYKQQVRLF